ncbi:MAG TPA: MFS transporter [Steroidobacteraceae bacterium]|nr:MFS transporter [Steroidobacteraceae bacterium]
MGNSGFYGWKLVGAFWVIVFINLAFAAYGSPVMNAAMAQQMHLSRTLAGLPYSLYIVMSALPSVLIAVLVRSIGVRRTVVLGSLLILAGCLMMATVVHSAIGATLVFGVVIACGVCAGGVFGTQPGVMLWFVRQRGLAIALVYSGGAVGGLFAAPLLNRVITAAGGNWRAGWWLYAALAAISTTVAAVCVRDRPSDLGQQPYGAEAAPPAGRGESTVAERTRTRAAEPGIGARRPAFISVERWTFAEVMRSGRFWIMVLALCGGSAGYTLFLAQGVLHLKDLGFDSTQAALALSVTTGSALLGKAPLALFGDRLDPRYIWAITSAVFGLGLILVIHPRTMLEVYLFSICVGIGWGGCIVGMMTTLGNYYGAEVFAAAAGVGGAVNTVISFCASIIGGMVYDRLGSYAPTLLSLAAWCVAGAIALALVGRPVRRDATHAAAVPAGGGT